MSGRLITDVSGETADTISCCKLSKMSAVSLMDYMTSHPRRISLGTAMRTSKFLGNGYFIAMFISS